jgi:hypothetical protein
MDVGGRPVGSMAYADVINVIRASPQRPLALTFISPQIAEINRLYGKYNPEKLADVPTLVGKYGPDQLLAMVRKKYKQQEGGSPAASPGVSPRAGAGVNPRVEEVQRLYGKYNPEKLADIPSLVAKYGEENLLAMVRKKYRDQEGGGASPGTSPRVGESPQVAEINRLYGTHNPEKLADVPGLIAKYGEAKLLAMVAKKYREQEEAGGEANVAFGSDQVEEIHRLYGRYNPEKLSDVPGLLTKYGVDKLLAMVKKKYAEQESRKLPTPSAEVLMEAARNGDLPVIAHCMESGMVYVDSADEFTGNTALMEAAVTGSIECVRCLLKHSAGVNNQCNLDQTALLKAAGFGHSDIVKLLVQHGAVRPPLLMR